MHPPLNRTEAFVLSICQESFLAFWCYANPRAEVGKELCDVLVVCDPDIIILSVKEVLLNETKTPEVAHARWERKAIDASVAQLYGATGWLSRATHVIRRDGSAGLNLPAVATRRVHRIAVAFGDKGEAIIKSGDFGKGFVHVMNEESFRDVLTELDTIEDFVGYLVAKEAFAYSGTVIVCEGPESNLLGWYLTHNRTFPVGYDVAQFDATIWPGLSNDSVFKHRKVEDRPSYAWDRLIHGLSDPNAKPIQGPGPDLNDLELALRAMARESRFNRRALGTFALAFLNDAKKGATRGRLLRGPSGVIYVMAYFPPTETPEMRSALLAARCYIARFLSQVGEVIVGIGLSDHVPGVGSASDLVYMKYPVWTATDDATARKLQRDTGFFLSGTEQHQHFDEYPSA
jgi:hypothetical protein